MKKRFLSILMTLCLSLTLFPEAAFAAELDNPESPSAPTESEPPTAETGEPITLADKPAPTSSSCGTNLTWTLERNDDGQSSWSLDWTYKLTISGTGAMNDYEYSGDNCAPWHNYSITEISIEDSVTSVGNCAFFNCCRKLTSITIPDSVTSIGNRAFQYCNVLTSISIPNNVTNIGERAFSDSGLTSIIIPNSVTNIGENAFSGTELTRVDIPARVIRMDNAFNGCQSLTEINVNSNNRQYSSKDGAVYTKEGNKLLFCPQGKTSYEIPIGVTDIGNLAFSGCSKLTNVTIPNSVTSIGYYAFSDCSALTSITIPGNVANLENHGYIRNPIGSNAFSDCTSLADVTISDGVAALSMKMFSDCTKLKNITIPASVKEIGTDVFENCTSLETITYTGNETQWGQIKVSDGNQELSLATLVCTGNANTPDNPDTPDNPSTPTTPGTLDIDMTNGSLGKRLTVEVKSGHWLTIQTRRAGSIAITALQAPNSNNGTVSVTFSASLGSTVQVWETESEMTFTNGVPNNKILNTVVKSL